jgi:hypothetical protein
METLTPLTPTFTTNRQEDGSERVTVDFLPPLLRISDEFLLYITSGVWRCFYFLDDGSRLRIEVENAVCTYRKVRKEPECFTSLWIAESG